MKDNNTLNILKQTLEKIVPKKDGRSTINPLEFIVTLIFCYLGDSKTFSLESIRRNMMDKLNKKIVRSSFWERIAGNRVNNHLRDIITELMTEFTNKILVGHQILKKLNVISILLIDSSTITLLNKAKNYFSGTGSAAGIKWHSGFNALTGALEWLQISPSSIHDRRCFPNLNLLKGKLVIFDLGYFDYNLMLSIEKIGGFFLSRLKSNSVVYIAEVVKGLSKKVVGKSLLSLEFSPKKGPIIEAIIEKTCNNTNEILRCRAIGFWNPDKNIYHWYLTNLTAAAYFIYPLYRLRWQIELIFKSCKNSLNADQIPSANNNIIESLLLASIVAYLTTHTILCNSMVHLDKWQLQAISVQRIAKIAVNLSRSFIKFLLNSSSKYLNKLLEKIKLFSSEIFDPNYNNRKTSTGRIYELL